MKFFVPHTSDLQAHEELYRLVRGTVEGFKKKTSDRRIWRVEFVTTNGRYAAEVGHADPLDGDTVFAIYLAADGSEVYLCTPSRGMFNDQPITLPRADISVITDFTS
jgi:hypothetical protein